MAKLGREVQIKFRVTAHEKELIKERMKMCGIKNMARFLRLMAINGCIINTDYSELKARNYELHKIGFWYSDLAVCAHSRYRGTVTRKRNDQGDFYDLRALELDRSDVDPSARTVLTSYAHRERRERKAETQYKSTYGDPFLREEFDRDERYNEHHYKADNSKSDLSCQEP